MDSNAAAPLAAAVGGNGDVHGTFEWTQQLPMNSGGTMAQHGAWTTGEHGSHPMRLLIDAEMADRVDPLMQTMQPPTANPLGDRRGRQPSRHELPGRDDPVLRTSNCSDAKVDWGGFANH
ncbi:MAG TPA: hypothetical protein VHP56_00255 [Solirubrobacterales bacterium]|nr:hypothetical protein [Solirubrobacterales bacterium]